MECANLFVILSVIVLFQCKLIIADLRLKKEIENKRHYFREPNVKVTTKDADNDLGKLKYLLDNLRAKSILNNINEDTNLTDISSECQADYEKFLTDLENNVGYALLSEYIAKL